MTAAWRSFIACFGSRMPDASGQHLTDDCHSVSEEWQSSPAGKHVTAMQVSPGAMPCMNLEDGTMGTFIDNTSAHIPEQPLLSDQQKHQQPTTSPPAVALNPTAMPRTMAMQEEVHSNSMQPMPAGIQSRSCLVAMHGTSELPPQQLSLLKVTPTPIIPGDLPPGANSGASSHLAANSASDEDFLSILQPVATKRSAQPGPIICAVNPEMALALAKTMTSAASNFPVAAAANLTALAPTLVNATTNLRSAIPAAPAGGPDPPAIPLGPLVAIAPVAHVHKLWGPELSSLVSQDTLMCHNAARELPSPDPGTALWDDMPSAPSTASSQLASCHLYAVGDCYLSSLETSRCSTTSDIAGLDFLEDGFMLPRPTLAPGAPVPELGTPPTPPGDAAGLLNLTQDVWGGLLELSLEQGRWDEEGCLNQEDVSPLRMYSATCSVLRRIKGAVEGAGSCGSTSGVRGVRGKGAGNASLCNTWDGSHGLASAAGNSGGVPLPALPLSAFTLTDAA